MKIVLSGYMGSGKTGIGKLLSEKMAVPFFDSDEEICLAEKRSIPDIFKSSGEIYFRKKETFILKNLLKSEKDYILALGGGTPCYGKNLQILKETKDSKLVYLKTSLDVLTERLFKERCSRPVISHLDSKELLNDFIRKHLFERTYYYTQSDLTIVTDGKDKSQIAEEILTALK